MNQNQKHTRKFLQDLKKEESSFLVPENYFDHFEDYLDSRLFEEQLPNEIPFQVPDSYFTSLEQEVLSKVSIKQKKVITLKRTILTMIPTAAAACVLLFIGLNYFTETTTSTFETISTADLEEWYDENYEDYSMQYIDSDFELSPVLDEDISLSDDDIFEYFTNTETTNLLTEIEL